MILTSKKPDFFPEARDFHSECGPYQLRAVLNALGKDAPIEDLYFNEFTRKRDWSLPYLFPSILKRYDVRAKFRFWLRPSFSANLLETLKADVPALFVVNSIHGNGNLHWISAWGHDPVANEFLVYDSQHPASDGPHGNTRYHASLLERVLPWKGTFAVKIL